MFVCVCYEGDQIKENETGGNVARMGEMQNASYILVGEPEGKRLAKRCYPTTTLHGVTTQSTST